jgi:predicted nucleotidyltransferase
MRATISGMGCSCSNGVRKQYMTTHATIQKRQELMNFIELELAPEPAVQAVIGIGSIASGLARADSDIDAIVFLDPFDAYIVPAEFVWRPADRTFHSIFIDTPELEKKIQFDFHRFDLTQWMDPSFHWPEGVCSELSIGWLAFDRTGIVADLIAKRTIYTDTIRISKLDEAVTSLDQHLSGDGPQVQWDSLGPLIAHDRLHAAYDYLVQALFTYNRRWRHWRNREMSALLALPWLPEDFPNRALIALGIGSPDYAGYMNRVEVLRGLFQDLSYRLVADGLYGDDFTSEAFIRGHDEPGRAWNMDDWNRKHADRHE